MTPEVEAGVAWLQAKDAPHEELTESLWWAGGWTLLVFLSPELLRCSYSGLTEYL